MDRVEEGGDLARLARRIADGRKVDWERESSEGTVTLKQVRHLKLVERISDAHRRLLLDELPFKTWGPLDLKHAIGTGGFGDVYLARDRNLDRDVALKLFNEDDDPPPPKVFLDEARSLARVRHQNVVTVHGVDRHNGRTGVWMDWIDGDTLKAIADDRGPFAAAEAAHIGIELCRALAAIHGAGLVHRDVKLSNVMRERGGRIVLMDFGSSTRSGDGKPPLLGTPVYMPPESFEERDSGALADIYALGVVLYRLTGGNYPIDFGTAGEMRRAHREGKAVPLRDRNPDLPPAFVRVVERAIDPDPQRRFATAGEMERALAASLDKPRPASAWKQPAVRAALLLVAVVVAAFAIHRTLNPPFRPDARLLHFGETHEGTELTSGMRVRVGDQLRLDVKIDRTAWLYVVTADAKGNEYVLFPVKGIPLGNPVPPGSHTLPGRVDGEDQLWDVTSAGGTELLVIVASIYPLDFIEKPIEDIPAVEPGAPVPLGRAGVVTELRGIGGMSAAPGSTSSTAASGVEDIVDGVRLRQGKESGIRFWEYVLPNPEAADAPP